MGLSMFHCVSLGFHCVSPVFEVTESQCVRALINLDQLIPLPKYPRAVNTYGFCNGGRSLAGAWSQPPHVGYITVTFDIFQWFGSTSFSRAIPQPLSLDPKNHPRDACVSCCGNSLGGSGLIPKQLMNIEQILVSRCWKKLKPNWQIVYPARKQNHPPGSRCRWEHLVNSGWLMNSCWSLNVLKCRRSSENYLIKCYSLTIV